MVGPLETLRPVRENTQLLGDFDGFSCAAGASRLTAKGRRDGPLFATYSMY
jgi:hypothetical protein